MSYLFNSAPDLYLVYILIAKSIVMFMYFDLTSDPMAALRGLTMGQPVPGPRPPQQQTPPLGQHPQLSVQQTQQIQMTLARQQQAGQLTMRQQQQLQQRLNNPMGGPPQQGPPPMSQQSVMQTQMFNQQQQAAMQAQQLHNMQTMQNDPQQAMKVSMTRKY